MKNCRHKISQVKEGSIAWEMEIEPGDELLSINGETIEDVFDYHYLVNDEYIELLIRKPDGEEWELEIEKDQEEDLGLEFENSLMDEYRSCRNHCVFCFIDQMPPGMRETLYFKDDDSRLSFLQGNYVTLTNMSDHDIDRIIHYHLAPINISFQTTNPKLRCEMLHNRFAGALATLGACLGAGVPIKDAMKLANTASGIAIGKLGTATVTADELKMALSQRAMPDDGWSQKKKIITLEQAKSIVKHLRDQGKRVGFTNGCFDCCHLGHLNSFMQAKKLCDVLIAAVNSDASVKRYKGPSRPIQDEKTRALLLASLEMIDYVIVFEEDSPLHIVDALRPDIVAKEGYALENWPEGKLAQSYGGKAVILKRLDGYSTSGLVEKMKG